MAKYRVFTTSMLGFIAECQDIEAIDDEDANSQASSLVKLTNKKISKIIKVVESKEEVIYQNKKGIS